MSSATHRRSFLFALVFGLLAAGCVPTDMTRRDERYPRRPSPRVERTAADRAVRARIARDADRYVRALNRPLRLNRRQEQRIARLLADRTYDQVRRTHARDRDRAYPFPRPRDGRTARDWWRAADRRTERELNRRQRAVYRDLVRARYYERGRRHGQRGH